MSSLLYSLGRWCFEQRRRVAAIWMLAIVALGVLAGSVGTGFVDEFRLPNSPGQDALDSIGRTFPEISSASASMVVVAPPGSTVDSPAVKRDIDATLRKIEKIDGVAGTSSPFDELIKGSVSKDHSTALAQIDLKGTFGEVTQSTKDQLYAAGADLRATGATVEFGGPIYTNTGPPLSLTEVVGLVIAFIVLFLTLGSIRGAILPLVTALVGAAVTMLMIFTTTGLVNLTSTTAPLALMIGLAVGIDYALFIVSRHRDELTTGLPPVEAAARAIATAGSAVIFAGFAVMVALAGLAIARIPFLTAMGLAAAASVVVAVAVAITLLPALLGFAGERLRPKPSSREKSFARRWVSTMITRPVATIALVVIALGIVALPARELWLALPDNGTSAVDTTQRKNFDILEKQLGPGYNAPLLASADLLGTNEPIEVMSELSDRLRKVPGVELIALATPNRNADTGVVQIIPTSGPTDQATHDLVERLRELAPTLEKELRVPIAITGATAIELDITDRLSQALLPFGLVVVGLSLLMLLVVFRSVLIPIKAAAGYLLSVGASFGVVVAVFQWGWLNTLLRVEQTGPVIAFLPIMLMGVLFGLAMDYEVFLVSRMKEEYARHGRAREAVEAGFAASAKVVVAAATIMFAVFAAFVPEGDASIKPIALGLAVGVFVDAFIVRMILVPAVLKLFSDAAWWLPASWNRRLPHVDVEGEGLRDRVALADWPPTGYENGWADVAVAAENLHVRESQPAVTLQVPQGDWLLILTPDEQQNRDLLLTLAGRQQAASGALRVAGALMPYESNRVRRSVALIESDPNYNLDRTIGEVITEQLSTDHVRLWISQSRITQVISRWSHAVEVASGRTPTTTANTPVSALTPLEATILHVVVALTRNPRVVIVERIDALRSPADRRLLWRALDALCDGVTVVAGIASRDDLPADDVPPFQLLSLTTSAQVGV